MQISASAADTMASILSTNLNGGDGNGSPTETSGGAVPPPSSLAAAVNSAAASNNLPQALHNLQRLLQSQLANVNPLQLQQVLQRQQVRKGA